MIKGGGLVIGKREGSIDLFLLKYRTSIIKARKLKCL